MAWKRPETAQIAEDPARRMQLHAAGGSAMAHLYPNPSSPYAAHGPRVYRPARHHVHMLALLLLAAVVLIVTLGIRDHAPVQPPRYEPSTPMTAPMTAPR
jgi:hypothetical protein